MLFAKNLSTFFSENMTLAIILLSAFCVCALSIAFLTLFAWIKSVIYNQIKNIFFQISVINSFANRSYFMIVERISLYDTSCADRVATWRKKINRIHKVDLVRVFKDFHALLVERRSLKPSFANIGFYRAIDKQLSKIYKNSYEIFLEMNTFLIEEHVFRNRTIQLKSFFDDLKNNLWTLHNVHNEIKYKKIEEIIENVQLGINNLIVDIYNVDYESALKQINDLDEDILNLIILLDKVPNLFSKVNRLIPMRVTEMKNKYQQNNHLGYVSAIVNKVIQLEQAVNKKRAEINIQLSNLNFRAAAIQIDKVLATIKAVKDSIEFGDRLYNLLADNIDFLLEQVNLLDEVQINLEKKFNATVKLTKKMSEEQKFKEHLKVQWNAVNSEVMFLIRDFKADTESFTKEKLSKYKQRFMEVIEKIIGATNNLEKLNKFTENTTISSDKINTSLMYSQSLIAQCEIKIKKKMPHMNELNNFIRPIAVLNNEAKVLLDLAKNELGQTISANELNDKINELNLKIEDLNTNINNSIFLDYISQELIIYLERFISTTPQVDIAVNNLEKMFTQHQYDQLIGYWVKIMHNLSKVQRR